MHAASNATKEKFLTQWQVVNYIVDKVVCVWEGGGGGTVNLAKCKAPIRKLNGDLEESLRGILLCPESTWASLEG